MEAKQPERGGGTMPRLDCLAAMEALAKVAGGVTGQGFGTAGTPWKGWESGKMRVESFCANVLSYFRSNELSIWEVGRNLNAERKFWFVHNLRCGDCASAGRGLVRNGMEAKRVDSHGAQRNMSLLV